MGVVDDRLAVIGSERGLADMSAYFRRAADLASFRPEQASKTDLFRGGHLFVGLNCFEPGQAQPVHTHAGADKFYFLISGKARMTVGEETRDASAGDVIWAPAGVPHGVAVAMERSVFLVAIGPPPGR
jgi:quercetin dioxygenase-like cupin family protein